MTSLSELHSYISEELQEYDIDFLLHQSSLRKCTRVITNDYINKQKRINSITLMFLHWLHENCNNRIQESSLSVKKDPYKLSPSRYCLRRFHCNCNDKIIIKSKINRTVVNAVLFGVARSFALPVTRRDKVAKPLFLAATANKHSPSPAGTQPHTYQAVLPPGVHLLDKQFKWHTYRVSKSPLFSRDFVFCTQDLLSVSVLPDFTSSSVNVVFGDGKYQNKLLTSVKANVTLKYNPRFTLNWWHGISWQFIDLKAMTIQRKVKCKTMAYQQMPS